MPDDGRGEVSSPPAPTRPSPEGGETPPLPRSPKSVAAHSQHLLPENSFRASSKCFEVDLEVKDIRRR
jgi:hypothetical protein